MERRRALIIGGSLAGLFAANLLRAAGWHVAVFERSSSDLKGRGAGLGIRPALFAVMRQLGIRTDHTLCAEVNSRICVDLKGDTVCEVGLPDASTAWDSLYSKLKDALGPENYHPGKPLARFVQDGRGVTAMFADGTSAAGEILVAADGIRSTVRGQLLPELEPTYAGYVAWRGIVEEQQIPLDLRTSLFSRMVFFFPPNELAFSVPIPPAEAGGAGTRRCMYVWFRPAAFETTLRKLCTDAAGRLYRHSIPPSSIRAEVLADLKYTAMRTLPPHLASLVARAEQPILSPILDLESPKMAFDRVALLGDAAFVARPHVGTGVTKAALDAQALADALTSARGDLKLALTRYDADRGKFGGWLVARGRYLGSILESHGDWMKNDKCTAVERYLREYGSAAAVPDNL
jgi:2-polyprenyl-6-methoxyphenol hydroxylase-like FAD-dependent oxidoreductase